MRALVIVILSIFCTFACAENQNGVDRTFVARGDMTGDGISEVLKLHITSKTIDTPFKWDFTVLDLKDNILFQVSRDDKSIDKFFNDKDYVTGCADYRECKDIYYFYYLPNSFFASLISAKEIWGLDEFKTSNLKNTVNVYLSQRKLPNETILSATNEMLNILNKKGYYTLSVPISPVQSAPPMIWVPSVKIFVPYYQE